MPGERMRKESDFKERTCKTCGKKFFPPYIGQYAYKRPNGKYFLWFCSYSCIRAYDSVHKESKTRNTPSPGAGKPKKVITDDGKVFRSKSAFVKWIAKNFNPTSRTELSLYSEIDRIIKRTDGFCNINGVRFKQVNNNG